MQNFISGSLVWDNKDMYKDLARIMFITALFRIVSDDNLYTTTIVYRLSSQTIVHT